MSKIDPVFLKGMAVIYPLAPMSSIAEMDYAVLLPLDLAYLPVEILKL